MVLLIVLASVAILLGLAAFLVACAAYYHARAADHRTAEVQAGNDEILRRVTHHDSKYGKFPAKIMQLENAMNAVAERYSEVLADREAIWDQLAQTDKTAVASAIALATLHSNYHHPTDCPN